MLVCTVLSDNALVTSTPNYQDLFSYDKAKIATIGRLLLGKFELLNTDIINCNATCTDSSGAATDIISVDLE